MNTLIQDTSLLVGNSKDIELLSQKEEAALLIISDSHGSVDKLKAILEEKGPVSDSLIFCGDGMNDICTILSQASYDDDLRSCLPPVIAFVQGNNDSGSYILRTQESSLKVPLTQIINVSGHNIFITHGHRFSLYSGTSSLEQAAQSENAEIVLYGHTHEAFGQKSNDMLILNPGSCSLPRGNQLPCFSMIKLSRNSSSFGYMFYEISGRRSHLYSPDFPTFR